MSVASLMMLYIIICRIAYENRLNLSEKFTMDKQRTGGRTGTDIILHLLVITRVSSQTQQTVKPTRWGFKGLDDFERYRLHERDTLLVTPRHAYARPSSPTTKHYPFSQNNFPIHHSFPATTNSIQASPNNPPTSSNPTSCPSTTPALSTSIYCACTPLLPPFFLPPPETSLSIFPAS